MMGSLKLRGILVGLAGNIAVAVALYHMLQIGSCGNAGQASCPDKVVPYMLLLPVGIVVSMVGLFMGGGAVTFAGIFLAVGLGSMASSALAPGAETETFGWIFGGMFTVFGLLPLIGGLALRPFAAAREAEAMRLVETGGQGIGTIVGVRDTGITINDNPRVEVTMRIEPIDGSAPIERSKTVTVSRVSIPRQGERFPVWYDRQDPENWAFGVDMEPHAPPQVKALFERARGSAAADAAAPEPPEEADSPLEELTRLNELRKASAVSEEEFARAKAILLARLARDER